MILYIFIAISGTIGNAIVIKSFIRASDKPGSRFVVGLALIDLVASFLVPFYYIVVLVYAGQHWPLGKIACFMIVPWLPSPFFASAWMLVVISAERAR